MSNSVTDQKTPSPQTPWSPSEATDRLDQRKPRWLDLKATMQRGVRKYPLATLLAGFALGAVVGWFIKRR